MFQSLKIYVTGSRFSLLLLLFGLISLQVSCQNTSSDRPSLCPPGLKLIGTNQGVICDQRQKVSDPNDVSGEETQSPKDTDSEAPDTVFDSETDSSDPTKSDDAEDTLVLDTDSSEPKETESGDTDIDRPDSERVNWVQSWGADGSDRITGLEKDPEGNIFVTGYFDGEDLKGLGPPTTGGGGADIYVAKLKPSGEVLWRKTFGGAHSETARDLAVDSKGDIYIFGSFESPAINFGSGALSPRGRTDVFLSKFSNSGEHLWTKTSGGVNEEEAGSMALTKNGDVVTICRTNSETFDVDGQKNHEEPIYVLTSWSLQGQFNWTESFDKGNGSDPPSLLATNTHIYLSGYSDPGEGVDFGGGGAGKPDTADIYLVKLDSSGNHQWTKLFGGRDIEQPRGSTLGPSGNPFVFGSFTSITMNAGDVTITNKGKHDAFVLEVSENGEPLWGDSWGGSASDVLYDVGFDSAENRYVTGEFQSKTVELGGKDTELTNDWVGFILSLDSDGHFNSSFLFGNDSKVRPKELLVTEETLLVAGYGGKNTFPGTSTNGYLDVFLASIEK